MSQYILFFSTTNNVEDARRIAEHLVQQRVAACVNIVPSITSVYWWKEKVTQDQESLLIIKTTADKAQALEQTLRSIHSYEVPELIGFEVRYGLPEYLKWMEAAVAEEKE